MEDDRFVWWKHGIIYQIYPRSFYDSNGDGTGDIRGIIQKLDYLRYLGIHGIWISPIYKSPMRDFGYDISDYRCIDPVFGTMGDFKDLIDEAHARDIHIVMDLVLNHTSSEHKWFVESRSSRDNPKRDWYIWKDGIKGKWPNNWMSAFGGHAWEWDDKTEQYYLHLFLREQPDLNWRNEEMKKVFFEDIRFWLDLGVDGFRLDVINFILKDPGYRDNPYFLHAAFPRRHDMQDHRNDRNQPGIHNILRDLRSLTDQYKDSMLVGEVYPNEGVHEPEKAAAYLGCGTDELHLAFNFSTIFTGFKADDFKVLLRQWYKSIPPEGWPCHVLSNHDQARVVSRLCHGRHRMEKMKVLAALLVTQRGTPFIYYGEEIGMSNGKVPRDRLADPVGIKYWPLHPGRDRERTPMQWSGEEYAGFSTSEPWLPVNDDFADYNVEKQDKDPGSLLSFYRDLIKLRKEFPALNRGAWEEMESNKNVLAYYRMYQNKVILVVLNFSGKKQKHALENNTSHEILMNTHRQSGSRIMENPLVLSPFEVMICRRII